MRTGEGKTLVATLPSYLNALPGKGVHVVTVNEYLAARDAAWMGKIHRFLGLTVGALSAICRPRHVLPHITAILHTAQTASSDLTICAITWSFRLTMLFSVI